MCLFAAVISEKKAKRNEEKDNRKMLIDIECSRGIKSSEKKKGGNVPACRYYNVR